MRVAPFASFSAVPGQNATFVSWAASRSTSSAVAAVAWARTRFGPSPPSSAMRAIGDRPCFRSTARASSIVEAM